MKVILDGTDSQPFDQVGDIRALVVYQNAAFALRSKAMLERVGRAAGKGGRLIYTLWDFDSLAAPALMAVAADDARNSDIVVFAAQEGEILPRAVRNWISCWIGTRSGHPRAIVASLQFHPEHSRRPPVLLPYLAQVAEHGKMHFFSGTTESLAHVDMDLVRVSHGVTIGTEGKGTLRWPAPATDTQAEMPNESERFSPQPHSKKRAETSMREQGAGKEQTHPG